MTRNPKKSTDSPETPDNTPDTGKETSVPADAAKPETKVDEKKPDSSAVTNAPPAPAKESGKADEKPASPKAASFEGIKPVEEKKAAETGKTTSARPAETVSSAKPSAEKAKKSGGGYIVPLFATLLLVIVLAVVGYFMLHQPTISAFKQQIAQQEASLASLKETLGAVTARLDTAEKSLKTLDEQERNTQEVLAGLAQSSPVVVSPPADTTTPSADVQAALQATMNRVTGLEKDIEALAGAIEILGKQGAAPAAPAVDLSGLDALEKQQAALSKAVAALRETLNGMEGAQSVSQSLAQSVVLFGKRLDEVQKSVADLGASSRNSHVLALAVAQLRSAVERGDAFAVELKAVQGVAAPSISLDTLVAPFVSYSTKGIPTEEALLVSFPEMAPKVLQAALMPEDSPLIAGTLERLSSLVSIRRVDAGAEGDSTQAIMARAEAKIEANDMTGAVAELAALKGAAADMARPWLADAQARLAARSAMSALSAEAIANNAK